MKSKEFITEGDDRNINDVQKNHPEVYEFLVGVIGSMALAKQSTVSTFNVSNEHHVIIRIQPSAGLENTKRALSAEGHRYEYMEDMIQGKGDGFRYKVSNDSSRSSSRGNITEKWQFILPLSE